MGQASKPLQRYQILGICTLNEDFPSQSCIAGRRTLAPDIITLTIFKKVELRKVIYCNIYGGLYPVKFCGDLNALKSFRQAQMVLYFNSIKS